MAHYTRFFIENEDGIETFEFFGLLAIAALMLAIIVEITKRTQEGALRVEQKLDKILEERKGE